jgi:hypothetical protein
MVPNNKKVKAALGRLVKSGLSDEQIAIGIGQQMPGGAHPSSMSVYRWRIGKNKPRGMYGWAILEMAKAQKESA